MDSVVDGLELAEPQMREVLSMAKLDVEYVRAEGNSLYHLDAQQEEVQVADFVGGYASLLLGHSNPEIIAHAKATLDAQTPVYVPIAIHAAANRVAHQLNAIIHRETGSTEPYFAIFASTGAEAIESSLKHAEFVRTARISALTDEIGSHVEQVRAAIKNGDASVAEAAYARLGLSGTGIEGFEEVAAEVQRRNAETSATPPRFLAVEGAFHGKLVGSVQLTHNASFRGPFEAMAARADFVPFNDPAAVAEVAARGRAQLLDLVLTDGVAALVERDFPAYCAFVLEPIQGEGGIKPVTAEFAAAVRQACDTLDCPLILDEIQCGMGRSGKFFASSHVGLHGDYYVLAKSLGGGIAKNSVMLVRGAHYRKEFELIHSSTFAKDGFSSAIALKVLELLEAEDGKAYRLAEERGNALRDMLNRVAADNPNTVKEVRGKGLMLGLEFQDLTGSSAPMISGFAHAGVIGYVIAGYLLRGHRVRVLPTGSAPHTLRFTPSIQLCDAEIDQLETALRDICEVLRTEDEQRLFG
ncbi:aspartate aminotransferase family protein [Nocardia suismassiliense]|uniref:aspartate aminotransferase family protein n=1 Tax=Nocardia suismassiliense TaxID=2077092 RepID=UPI0018FECDA9|nr:aminotransferase class III-fold pyridoxal phosphate-dependent enzyme [Nocardia suismassiliense]